MAEIIETEIVRRPRMLKEFLRDSISNFNSCSNSCSSSGFKSFPRTLPDNNSDPNSVHDLLDQAATTAAATLPRNRSRSRAAAEALGKLVNAVKSFHYSSYSPTPVTLPRSLSRRFLGMGMRRWSVKKREKSSEVTNSKIVVVTVKVKDILRWKSFRDHLLVENQVSEEESHPLDLVGPTEDAPSTSSSSDFTVTEEELPCWSVSSGDDEKWEADDVVVASDSEVGPKKDDHNIVSEEEPEQQSPVSVLESPFRDEVTNEEFISSFDQSLANMEKTKQRLLQSIQLFESLAGVHDEDETDVIDEEEEEEEEECKPIIEGDNIIEDKSNPYLSRGLCWFKRGGKGLEEKMECIKSMDKQRHWSKFEEERLELEVELEVMVLNDLLDEALIDVCG